MGRSESGHDDADDGGASGNGAGSTGMKEKEVGVVSDCNTLLWQHQCREHGREPTHAADPAQLQAPIVQFPQDDVIIVDDDDNNNDTLGAAQHAVVPVVTAE
jgi:hypothetical protein